MKVSGTPLAGVRAVGPLRPVVAIVGRPNVGKSTLFNRLLGGRWAIIDDQPGVTRDLIQAQMEWGGHRFTLVDTGGYVPRSKDAIAAAVCAQAEQAIEEADVVILLGDATTGTTDIDREVAQLLLQRKCPCMVVVNKVDQPDQIAVLDDFYRLGLGEPVAVSAATGRRSGAFLEQFIQRFEDCFVIEQEEEDPAIKVVLVGRPNVGKSTLINRLAGQRVSLVHKRPGTTRDTTHIRLDWKGQEFVLMDTAGLRRRSRVGDPIEYYSSLRASSSIDSADIALALIDAVEGCTLQDIRIINQVIEAGCGLVIAVNKWDLIDTRAKSGREFLQDFHHKYPFLEDYPLLFVSALTGKKLLECLESVSRAYGNYSSRVGTAHLNRLVEKLSRDMPPAQGGREVKLLYATQHGVTPPTFVVFSNRPELVNHSYKRFFEKQLRAHFGLTGTPIRMVWRKRRTR